MSGTFTLSVGDVFTTSADQIGATQTSSLSGDPAEGDAVLTVTKQQNASNVFINSATIESVNLDQTVQVELTQGDTITVDTTTYGVTVDTDFGTTSGTIDLLGGNATQVLVADPSIAAGGVLLSNAAQSFGSGLDYVIAQEFQYVSCFAEGTRIRTADGEVAVEALRVGDRVVSAFGGTVPVTWLGHRRIDCRRHARPHDVRPIRVARDAFGPGRPQCDLVLSPDHAVHVAGVLIPIRYLVNGATIAPLPVEVVTYWHVELPAHDVILAEGLPAESYLDTGNRASFANAGTTVMAQAAFARAVWQAEGCAELVIAGPVVAAEQARLLARAEALGHIRTGDPALHIRAGGRMLWPRREAAAQVWDLPAGTGDIRLVSRRAVPAWIEPGNRDHRVLGVAVSSLRLDGQALAVPDAAAGWHKAEAGWRWTDGDATLAAGPGRLEVTLGPAVLYWAEPSAPSALVAARAA